MTTPKPSPRRTGKTLGRPKASPSSRQERMLEALEGVFLREGFRDVTVEQLARHLHCSRRTLYDLAPSKEDLFLRVFDRYLARLRDEGNERAAGVPAEQAFVPFLTPAIDAARKLSVALMRDMTAYPPANEMWERHQRERMAGLRSLVERCVEQGVFRNANAFLVAEVVAASLRRIREPNFLSASRLSYREAVAELYGLLLHGLLHPEAADFELKGSR
jgi:AcrR family transcriptional regulator